MNVRTVTTTAPIAAKATTAGRLHTLVTTAVSPRPCLHTTRFACVGTASIVHHGLGSSARSFSSTPPATLRVKTWFPPPESPRIKFAGPAWEHPVYSEQMMKDIAIAHRDARDWKDRLALRLMRLARFCMDTATGYAEEVPPSTAAAATESSSSSSSSTKPWTPRPMDERKWLIRLLFLESIAGVPGMVAGMLRHLHSLRRLKRDNGWIETLLEEAYNERMHLLTFMKLAEPGWFMKTMILGAQGVFFNGFFLSYLLSPRTCHRFVGYLEEEAVYTYTRILRELDAGQLPRWTDPTFMVPDIAVRYWNMPEGHRTMRDLILYVRADEAKHREVNHTLGNLDQIEDPNPFIAEYVDPERPHPTAEVSASHQRGWERKEVIGKE